LIAEPTWPTRCCHRWSRIPQRINVRFAVRIRLNDGENLRLPAGTSFHKGVTQLTKLLSVIQNVSHPRGKI
jgi:hypothetical protein